MNRGEGRNACRFCEDITKGRVSPDAEVWLHANDFPPLQTPVGEAYVVIYSRDHHRTFTQLTVDEVNAVTLLWRALYRALSSRYPTAMIFENRGESNCKTQHTSHTHALATPHPHHPQIPHSAP